MPEQHITDVEVWLLRHGETRAQTGEEMSLDPGLSEEGTRQAFAAGKLLEQMHFDLVLVSPLKRTYQTFMHAVKGGLSHDSAGYDTRLVENIIPGGYLPLLPYPYHTGIQPDKYDAWDQSPEKRIESLRSEIREMPEKGIRRVLLVSHGAFFSDLLASCIVDNCGNKNGSFISRMDNGALSMLKISQDETKFSMLVLWNHQPLKNIFSGEFYAV